MNYGREGIQQKKAATKPARNAGVIAVLILLTLSLASVVVITCLGFGAVKGIIDGAPAIEDVNFSPSGFATFIYDSDGNQLQKLTTSDSNRTAVSLDRVPADLQHAVVAAEDERFYQHNGIDSRGIIRALFVGLKNRFRFTEGASTITQQLLKNNVFKSWTEEKSLMDRIRRKFQEQYLAVKLEEKLNDKGLILENYLNTINLGAGTYGVQAAAKKYFNKDVSTLTLSEATVIAGITQNPAKYNPIRHPDYNSERRTRILNKMVELGYISQEQMDAAVKDPVYDRIAAAQEIQSHESTVYSYFVDELTRQVIDDLIEQKGYSEKQAYQLLYSGGLRIETTQDPHIQAVMDKAFTNEANFPPNTQFTIDWALSVLHPDGTQTHYSKEQLRKYYRETYDENFDLLFDSTEDADLWINDYKAHVIGEGDKIAAERLSYAAQPQASMVIIEQSTGQVKALVGGRGEKTASLTLSRATGTYRQPGSTFKVLAAYATALEHNNMTLDTVYVDEPYAYSNGRPVNNWLTNTYQGPMTIRDAIVNSVNVVAVKCITDVTPRSAYQQLLRFGFTSLDPVNDVYQPLALGGIYRGVSNLELTAAYASLANAGTYIRPVFYTRITDQNGEVILDNTPQISHPVGSDTAYFLTTALQEVVKRGTGQAMQLDSGMPVAGKTGTTSNYNDVWFVGYTPYLTCGVWAGYDNNESLPGDSRTYHWTLWKTVMEEISKTQPVKDFSMPDTVRSVTLCADSGQLAGPYCQHTRVEIMSSKKAPGVVCQQHLTPPTPKPTPTPKPSPTPTKKPTQKPTKKPTEKPDIVPDEPSVPDEPLTPEPMETPTPAPLPDPPTPAPTPAPTPDIPAPTEEPPANETPDG